VAFDAVHSRVLLNAEAVKEKKMISTHAETLTNNGSRQEMRKKLSQQERSNLHEYDNGWHVKQLRMQKFY
jgi:hypothetical protein